MRLPRPSGLPVHIPAKWWKWRRLPGRYHAPKPHAFWLWRKWRQSHTVKPVTSILMFDDVNVSLLPADAQAVAGYVDGRWATWSTVYKKFPNAKKLSIAVFASDDADCLDVEPLDATPAEAPAWVKRQKQLGVRDASLPVLYTSASQGQTLVDACSKAGLRYGKDYLWWSAHYDPAMGKHLCGPKCGFGLKQEAHATQFTDRANNVNLDESICTPGFFK